MNNTASITNTDIEKKRNYFSLTNSELLQPFLDYLNIQEKNH